MLSALQWRRWKKIFGRDGDRDHGGCKTRQDTWRIKRSREEQRVVWQAPSKKMGATTEGTKDVHGCDDGGKSRKGSHGRILSLKLRLPIYIPQKDLGFFDDVLA